MSIKHILGGLALIGATLFLMSEQANAQAIYGPNGQYQGMAQTSGNVTNIYNQRGELIASMQSNGSQTSLYSGQGRYEGYIDAPIPAQPVQNQFMNIVPQVPQVPHVRQFGY